jgi:hypothetical protein
VLLEVEVGKDPGESRIRHFSVDVNSNSIEIRMIAAGQAPDPRESDEI